MYYGLTVFISVLISLMVVINGQLSEIFNVYLSTVIIHLIGLIPLSFLCIYKKQHLSAAKGLPISIMIGGAVGVATTVFNNMAYGQISVSAIVALSLFGQAVTALLIDQLGLFGMPIRKFNKGKLIGFGFTLLGISCLVYGSAFVLIPIILSILTGVSIVISRNINALLAQKTSVLISTWYNYIVGLSVSLVVMALAFGTGNFIMPQSISTNIFIYTGGALGILVVSLSSIAAVKMPAFVMTLILFAGQVFTGIAIDALLTMSFSLNNMIGGAFAVIGLTLNLWLDKKSLKNL